MYGEIDIPQHHIDQGASMIDFSDIVEDDQDATSANRTDDINRKRTGSGSIFKNKTSRQRRATTPDLHKTDIFRTSAKEDDSGPLTP
jgi:hypothetical protein